MVVDFQVVVIPVLTVGMDITAVVGVATVAAGAVAGATVLGAVEFTPSFITEAKFAVAAPLNRWMPTVRLSAHGVCAERNTE